jgi:hypothetical protein
MDIRYRREDGTQEPISHAGMLRSLVDAGEIVPDTPMYDQYRGAWCPASQHPMAKALFAPQPVPVRTPPPALTIPRPSEHSPPDTRLLTNVLAGSAMGILLLGLFILLVAADSESAIVSGLRTFGMLVALGTLLAIGILGMRRALMEKSHRLLVGVLSLIPVGAFVLFLAILLLSRLTGGHAVLPLEPPADTEMRSAEKNPLDVKPAPQNIEHPSGSLHETVEQIIGTSLATLERDQADFVNSLQRQKLDSAFRRLDPKSTQSIRTARKKVQYVSGLFETHPKKVSHFYDDVILSIEKSGLDTDVKADLAEAFRGERDQVLPELGAFFHSMHRHYGDIDRMLSFMEGIASQWEFSRVRMSEGDQLTLELYQSRLDDAADRLADMEKDLEAKLARVGSDTLDRIHEVLE